jgi:hypothetical protein
MTFFIAPGQAVRLADMLRHAAARVVGEKS